MVKIHVLLLQFLLLHIAEVNKDMEVIPFLHPEEFQGPPSENSMTDAGYYDGDMQGKYFGGHFGILPRKKFWADGRIPYKIHKSLDDRKSIIEYAFKHFRQETCINFVKRHKQYDYVLLKRKKGCYSHVGRRGGRQLVSLGHGCAVVGIVLHELMHAVGFKHEQNRPDRDLHIRILKENIKKTKRWNFRKLDTYDIKHHLKENYDIHSVTHYGEKAFSRDGISTTIETVSGERIKATWEKTTLSQSDIRRVLKLYRCGMAKFLKWMLILFAVILILIGTVSQLVGRRRHVRVFHPNADID